MAFKRGNTFSVYIPLRSGGSAMRGTGTADRKMATAIERMVKTLRDRREWELLEAVAGGGGVNGRGRVARITVGELYDAYASNTLDRLRARLRDVDLEPYVEDWKATLAARFNKPGVVLHSGSTSRLYVRQVRTLISEGKPFPRSDLTVERITAWLASKEMMKRASGTRLRYHAALSSFCGYLVDVGVLPRNLMRDVKPPRAGDPRMRHLNGVAEMEAFIKAQPAPFNVISAIAHCGVELGALLTIRRRDVQTATRTIDIHGTKSKARRRTIRVTGFAWPLVEAHIATLLPGAQLFEGIGGWEVRAAHHAACKALGIDDYRVHDARHSFAVWLIREGTPAEVIARQLGHATTKMVNTVYGRFRVTEEDTALWLERAESRAAEPRAAVAGGQG